MNTAMHFLKELAGRGVRLSVEAGQLSCYAPKGALTDELKAGIGRHRSEIMALLVDLEKRSESRAPQAPLAYPREFPLSVGEKGLYLLQQLEPGMSAYNVPFCFRFNLEINAKMLAKAWEHVLDQYPILTARIVEQDGVPQHVLDDACRTAVQRREIGIADDRELLAFLKAQAKVPFNLSTGPLSRVELFTQRDGRPILLVTFHHIIMDGASGLILLKTFFTFYEQLCSGKPVTLSQELPGYHEFVAWEENMLASAEGAAHAKYWQQQLDGELPVLQLLPDLPRASSTAGFEGRTLIEPLPDDLFRWVNDYGKANALPPAVMYVGLFQLLLHRYTNERDIIVGMPVMGRVSQTFSADVGYFVNVVPLRTRIEEHFTLSDFMRKVQGVMVDALYHSSYPFPLMLSKLRIKQNIKNPVFQASFVMHLRIPTLQHGTLTGEVLDVWQEGDSELGLEIFESDSGATVHIKYNPELYGDAAIRRFCDHYFALLRAISRDPASPLRDHSILTEEEAHRLLVAYNDTKAEYPKDRCVHELFAEQVSLHAGDTAVVCGEERLTFEQLSAQSRDLGLYLQTLGVTPDGRVGLCMERSADLVVAVLAILQAGGAYVPLDPAYPDDRLAYMLQDSQVAVVLTQDSLRDRITALGGPDVQVLALDVQRTEIADRVTALKAQNAQLHEVAKPHHLAYVIYTSGSTGKPKGVMVEHRSVINYLTFCLENYFAPEAGECASFLHFPLTFDASITSLFAPLLAGKAVDANPQDSIETIGGGEFLNRGYDFIKLTPSHLLLLRSNADRIPPEYFEQRNLIIVGGEALTHDHVEFLGRPSDRIEIVNEYGPTEATVGCTISRFPAGKSRQASHESISSITIGTPIANTQIYILDAYGHPQPTGVPGELYIAGDCLARGYLNRPELTEERFVANPFVPGARMYKTGDLARWLEDGGIQYLGRIDSQVKVRGFRIEMGEIEAELNQHAGIQDSAVIVRGQDANKHLVAFYRATESTPGNLAELPGEELRAHLARTLPEHMIPAAYVSIAAIPLSPNGKVDRAALGRIDATLTTSQDRVVPRNATEQKLAGIWAEVLSVEADRIGVHDSFFELGGHSLLATQLISRIRLQFGAELPLNALFSAGTVAQLALLIDKAEESVIPRIEPADRSQYAQLPLSFAQERLWFIHQLEPDNPGYNVPGAVTIRGELEIDHLDEAFNLVIARHDSLRTLFPSENGLAHQQILDRVDFRIERIDLSALEDQSDRAEEALRLCQTDAARPFDLATGPLMRGQVIKLAEDEHILMLNMHHIISDGWSMGVMIKELAVIMDAIRQGRRPELPALAIQYADYGIWQRHWLDEGGVLAKQLEYWQQKLTGAPDGLELPTDHPRPLVQNVAGASHAFALDADLASRLERLAEKTGSTQFMILLAALKVLLYRYTSQNDICIGSPIANRQYGETEGLVGMFVNTLALRSQVEEDDTFDALLAKVKTTCLEAYEHQDAPFEKIVDALRLQRNLAVSPLFQVMMVLQNVDLGEPDPRIARYPLDSGISKFDLTFELTQEQGGLSGTIRYRTALFEQETIERMVAHYIAICRAVTATPNASIDTLHFLDAAERDRLLVELNGATSSAVPGRRIHEVFAEQATAHPERTAVVYGEHELSYRGLQERSAELAMYLRSQGIGPDDRVGLYTTRSVEMVVGMLGIWQAGGAYVPLDPDYPAERLQYMVEDAAPSIVLTLDALKATLPRTVATLTALDGDWEAIREEGRAYGDGSPSVGTPDDLAYVIYTSGSTGLPKGVMVRHSGVVNLWSALETAIYAGHDDWRRVSVNASFSFDSSVKQFVQLLAGRTLILVPQDVRLDADALLRFLDQQRIDVFDCTPSQLVALLHNGLFDGTRNIPKAFLIGGEAIDAETWRSLGERDDADFFNVYGPAECTVDATVARITRNQAPHIGSPIENVRVYILDRQGQPVPTGVAGEICIGGAGVGRGYWNRPELTAERFVVDPFDGRPEARLYKSGDLGRWRADGVIEYAGRNDQQVKIRGHRIELGEIEAHLTAYQDVREAVVIAREDEPGEKRLVAYLTATGEAPGAETLRAHLLERLPQYMVPVAFVELEALPLTPNKKIDRRALPKPDAQAFVTREYEAPLGPVEVSLAEIWQELLRAERVGRRDNFFELGGHSLLATQLISKIRVRLEIDLPLRALFERPSLAELAQAVSDAEQNRIPPIRPVDRERFERLPLSFAQERLWFINQLEPDNAGYNVPGAVLLKGALDLDRMERAFNVLIARHENLRTLFPSHEGFPHQQVLDALDFQLTRVDLSGSSPDAEERERRAKELCQTDAVAPFDLAKGPLLRGTVIKLAEDEHLLMLNMHHIISDGWSMSILIRELAAIMDALSADREPVLPALPIQYADYSVWQRGWLEEGGVLGKQLDYWQQKLRGVPDHLDLATDYPRPHLQSYAGATHAFTLDAQLTSRLANLAERQGGTLYMVLLAALKALLQRYTGQEDICIGSPIANRQYGETEGLIGMFVNTLAMRSHVRSDDSFAALFAQVKATCVEAYDHQDAPFEKVVEVVGPQRNLAMSPLFQIMMVLQNAETRAAWDPRIRVYPLHTGVSKFDLTLFFNETADGLAGSIEYATALFKPETIARMVTHFKALCQAIVATPSAKLRELNLLGDAERHAVLVEYNDTQADYPADACLHDLFAEQVARDGDRVAVTCRGHQLTYRQLYDRSRDLALDLQSQGVGPDRLVGVCMDRSLDMMVALLGVLQAGGAYVPLDPAYPEERLAYMLRDSDVAIVLTQQSLREKLTGLMPAGAHLIALDALWPEIQERVARLKSDNVTLRQDVTPQNLAYVIYTSGSTGNPKGVAIEHHSPVTLVHWARDVYSPEELAGVLAATSICFDLSIYEIFLTLASGGTVILVPNVLGLLELANPEVVTLINTVPSAMEELVRLGAIPSSVRTVNLAGEPLSPRLVDKVYESSTVGKVYDLYGPSEDTTYSTYILRAKNAPQSIGRPIANTEVYILDPSNQLQPIGVPGELHIAGDGLARGYLHRPDLTDEKFVPNPFRPGTRMYRTGDRARWLDDGTLQYMGRIDTQVKIRGFRIELGEIEARLNQHPEVQESVAIAQGSEGNRQLVAFYRAKDSRVDALVELAPDELRAFLLKTLPDYMVPAAFVSLAEIPLQPNGKINRRALAQWDVSLAARKEYVAPRNATERELVEIWAQVLNVPAEKIGVFDDFFERGGHSLTAVQLMAKINKSFDRLLPLAVLFTVPNVAALAGLIAGHMEASTQILVPIRTQGDARPVFAVPGVGGNVLSLRPLSRSLGEGTPLYALQAVGLDGKTLPHDSVEQTARANVTVMKTVQPSGPYELIGHSYGGVVAFEMARILLEQGDEIASLVLLDSIAPSVMQRRVELDEASQLFDACMAVAQLYEADLKVDLGRLRQSSGEERLQYVVDQMNLCGMESNREQFGSFFAVYSANVRNYQEYRAATLPREFDVALYRATQGHPDGAGLPRDFGWESLFPNRIRIHDVDADHYSILEHVNLQPAEAVTSDG